MRADRPRFGRLALPLREIGALLLAVAVAASASGAAATDSGADREATTGLVRLSPHAWGYVARDDRSSNGAVFVGDEAMLVVDPGLTPAIAAEFLAAARSLGDQPIRWAVLTHWHPDHSLGLSCLAPAEIEVVAHPKTRRALAERGAGVRAAVASQARSTEEATALMACTPSLPEPLAAENKVFDLGGFEVEVFHPGAGHTAGDLVVWAPAEGVLVTGDLVMNGSCPSMGEGDLDVWIDALERLAALAPEYVVPGHFAPGGARILSRFRAYLVAQVGHAETAIANGLDIEASAAGARFPEFADFSQYPQYGATFEANARIAYRDVGRRPPSRGETAGFRLVARLDVGENPHQIAFSPDGETAYVAAAGADGVTLVDVARRRVTGTLSVPDTPLGVAALPDGRSLAVAAFGAAELRRFVRGREGAAATLDTGDGPSLITGPLPGGRYLVSAERADRLWVVDGDRFTLGTSYPTGRRPFPPAATHDGRLAFVPDYDDGTLTVIDLWNEKVVATVPVGLHPSGGAVLPGDIEMAVALRGENRIALVNTASHRVVGAIEAGIGSRPFSVALAPNGRLAFVNNTGSADVSIIDLGTRRVIARMPVGEMPITLAVEPSGAALWVACEGTHEVDVIAIPEAWRGDAPAASSAATESDRPAAGEVLQSTEVAVMGMIHSGHLSSPKWGLDQVRAAIRRFEPDTVCAEIPPDRWQRIWSDWTERGVIEDERLLRFPEYTEVLLPLAVEMGFTIEPCAAWTQEMSDLRQTRIHQFETEPRFAAAFAQYERENEAVIARQALDPIDADDPRVIHSPLYDERTRDELAPYAAYLNDWIGPGGWENVNQGHLALVEQVLDRHRGERVLITFGAGHKYWLREHLAARDDLEWIDLGPYLAP